MSSVPRPHPPEDFEFPETKIDQLLAGGDIEGACAELERLLLEGMEGEAIEMDPAAWEEFRQSLHRKAKLAS